MSEDTNSLTDFNWEEESFFEEIKADETDKKLDPEVSIKPKTGEDAGEEETAEEKEARVQAEKLAEEEQEFFEIDEAGSEEEQEEIKSDKSIYDDLYNDLKDTGIMQVELEEGESLDADKFFELSQENINTQVDQKIEGLFEEMPDEAKAFLKFVRDGGNTQEFFKAYSSGSSLIGEVDLEKETDQEKVIKHQLRQEGWDEEDITDRIEFLTENGKKKKFAEKYNSRISQSAEDRKQQILTEQAEAKKRAKAQKLEFKAELIESLKETTEYKGFKFTDKDKDLVPYMTQEKIPVSKTRNITSFQKDLGEALKDKDKLLLIGKLLKSDFDMTDFAKNTITKKTRKIKSNLEQRSGLRPTSSGSSKKGKTLAELF